MLKNIVQKMTFSKRIAAVRNSSTQFPPNAENCAQGPNPRRKEAALLPLY